MKNIPTFREWLNESEDYEIQNLLALELSGDSSNFELAKQIASSMESKDKNVLRLKKAKEFDKKKDSILSKYKNVKVDDFYVSPITEEFVDDMFYSLSGKIEGFDLRWVAVGNKKCNDHLFTDYDKNIALIGALKGSKPCIIFIGSEHNLYKISFDSSGDSSRKQTPLSFAYDLKKELVNQLALPEEVLEKIHVKK